jgi:hypothetical protein
MGFEQRMEAQGTMRFIERAEGYLVYAIEVGLYTGLSEFANQAEADAYALEQRLVVINDPGQSSV